MGVAAATAAAKAKTQAEAKAKAETEAEAVAAASVEAVPEVAADVVSMAETTYTTRARDMGEAYFKDHPGNTTATTATTTNTATTAPCTAAFTLSEGYHAGHANGIGACPSHFRVLAHRHLSGHNGTQAQAQTKASNMSSSSLIKAVEAARKKGSKEAAVEIKEEVEAEPVKE